MTSDQQSLLEEGHRLDELRRSYSGEAQLNESFIVLTVGASLIATLGLLSNNAAVVIGAMVVAPWILPLRVAVFALLSGSPRILFRSHGNTRHRRSNHGVAVDGDWLVCSRQRPPDR